MNRRVPAIVVFSLLLVPLTAAAQGAWEKLPAPFGQQSPLVALANHGSTVYMVERATNDFYRSDDDGKTWSLLSPLPLTCTILCADSSGGLLAGGSGDGSTLWRSEDQGTSWQPVSAIDFPIGEKDLMVVRDGSYLLTVPKHPALRSVDNGKTWEAVLAQDVDSTSQQWYQIGMFPDGLLYLDDIRKMGSFTGPDSAQLWQSSDNGATWEQRQGIPSLGYYMLDDSFYLKLVRERSGHNPSDLLCVSRRDPNGGIIDTLWAFGRGTPYPVNWVITSPDRILYLTPLWSYTGLRRSLSLPPSGLEELSTGFQGRQLLHTGTSLLYFGEQGPIRSTDSGRTWRQSSIGIVGNKYAGVPLILVRRNGNVVVRTKYIEEFDPDRGTHTAVPAPDISGPIGLAETGDGSLFIHSNTSGENLWRLEPGADVFTPLERPATERKEKGRETQSATSRVIAMQGYTTVSGDLLIVGREGTSSGGIDFYNANTSEWTSIPNPNPGTALRSDGIATTANGYLFAIYDSTIYRLPHADNWKEVFTKRQLSRIVSAGENNLLLLAGTTLYLSPDNGSTWQEIPPPADQITYEEIHLSERGRIYVSTQRRVNSILTYELYTTGIDNINWQQLQTDSAGGEVVQMEESSDGYLYAVISTQPIGVYRLQIPSSAPEDRKTTGAGLAATITPNPGSDNIMLAVEPSSAGMYRIRMIDMSGKPVLPAIEEYLEVGKNTLPIDISSLPSGSYRCEVVSVRTGERSSVAVQVLR